LCCEALGLSKEKDENDYSIKTLIGDTIKVIEYIVKKFPGKSVAIIGHSMGGAVAAKTVKEIFDKPTEHALAKAVVRALSVIDVAEGSAMKALKSMDEIIASKPKAFHSEEEAIIWTIKSGAVRTPESARISMPVTLIKDKGVYKWRTDLTKTREYWEGWFKGLSEDFMSAKVPKQLIIAEPDRMDTALTIGQMQGRFKLDVVTRVGHSIQEDDPKTLSKLIIAFLAAFKI